MFSDKEKKNYYRKTVYVNEKLYPKEIGGVKNGANKEECVFE
jgi:hypothetical protein